MKTTSWVSCCIGMALGGLGALAISCGANDVDAPAAPVKTEAECRSFEQLMPRFKASLRTGRTEDLRIAIEENLVTGTRPDQTPPMNDVVRAFFQMLARFAALPPEMGAPEGETCAAMAPPVALAHPICEMRRSMDVLVHQAKGLEAVKLVDPLISAVIHYILGKPPAASKSHFEVASVVSAMCQQNASCQLRDGLDLVVGVTAYLETAEGRAGMDRIVALVKNPAFEPFLQDDGAMYGGENGIVALANVVISTLTAMNDPKELDSLPIDQLPAELQPDLRAVLEDTKKMLDPKREPNILRPMKKALHCYDVQDPPEKREVIRMVYRLGLEANLPEFNLENITGAITGLRDVDQRGTLVHLAGTIAQAIRADETAVDSTAMVCEELFSRDVAPRVLPVIAELYEQNVTGEALCAVDTLLYGCAGGPQPACEAAQ